MSHAASPRALWKGAISFGLIHIPVELYPVEKSVRLDLDMLDKRDFAPVGYKRVNKETGEEVPWEDIVKGYEYEKGQYVVLTDEELRTANPEAAHGIHLLAFVPAEEIPLEYFEQPYFLAPVRGGDKVYALLRETLHRAGKIGLAQVVIRTRQTLAALLPQDDRLMLITLRYPHEIRAFDEAGLPSQDLKQLDISEREIDMALTLVDEMSEHWRPQKYKDTFHDDVMALINRKIASRETHTVFVPEGKEELPAPPRNVVDIVALLKQSLAESRDGKAAKAESEAEKASPEEVEKEKKRTAAARKRHREKAVATKAVGGDKRKRD